MRSEVLKEREGTHGSFEGVAKIAQQIKAIMETGEHNRPSTQNEALEMIATKIARIICGNATEPDHWRDIMGYAELGLEACQTSKMHDATYQGGGYPPGAGKV